MDKEKPVPGSKWSPIKFMIEGNAELIMMPDNVQDAIMAIFQTQSTACVSRAESQATSLNGLWLQLLL